MTMNVVAIMASVMPIATLTILPIAIATGDLFAVDVALGAVHRRAHRAHRHGRARA